MEKRIRVKSPIVNCWTTSTRIRTTQHVEINGIHGKAYYYNRPWERFFYQTALLDALRKIGASKANIRYIGNCTSETQARSYLQRYLTIEVK